MEAIDVFSKDSNEYKRLEAAAKLIEAQTGKTCEVTETMFDAGQDWKWTTILIESGIKAFPMCQALDPKGQEDIVSGNMDSWVHAVTSLIEKHK